jgi:hypothetical protein
VRRTPRAVARFAGKWPEFAALLIDAVLVVLAVGFSVALPAATRHVKTDRRARDMDHLGALWVGVVGVLLVA